MSRNWAGFAVVLLAACGPMSEPEPESEPVQEEAEPVQEGGASQLARVICGTTCPSGYHPTSYSCDSIRCGGRCGFDTKNQVS